MDSEPQLSPGTAFAFIAALALLCWGVIGAVLWAVFQATHGGFQ